MNKAVRAFREQKMSKGGVAKLGGVSVSGLNKALRRVIASIKLRAEIAAAVKLRRDKRKRIVAVGNKRALRRLDREEKAAQEAIESLLALHECVI